MGRVHKEWPLKQIKARIHSGTGQDGMRIELMDEASHLMVCIIEIPRSHIGDALFGAGTTCDVKINDGNPNVGKVFSCDNVQVWLPRDTKYTPESRKKWLAEAKHCCLAYQVDGWIVNLSDLENSNNIIRSRGRKQAAPAPPPGKSDNDGDWWNIHRFRYDEQPTPFTPTSEQ